MPIARHSIVAAALAALLSGCATSSSIGSDPLFSWSAFTLNEPLTIQTGWARSFVQHGEPVQKGDMAKFDPFCSLEVRTVAQPGDNLVVAPDRFMVTRVQRRHPDGGVFGGMLSIDEDAGPIIYELDIYLESASQPDVLRLNCKKWEADPFLSHDIRSADITRVLGDVGRFE